jgi:hypothetical protein
LGNDGALPLPFSPKQIGEWYKSAEKWSKGVKNDPAGENSLYGMG